MKPDLSIAYKILNGVRTFEKKGVTFGAVVPICICTALSFTCESLLGTRGDFHALRFCKTARNSTNSMSVRGSFYLLPTLFFEIILSSNCTAIYRAV